LLPYDAEECVGSSVSQYHYLQKKVNKLVY